MGNKHEGPRFHPKTVIPKIPEGKMLVKFHGKPAVISARGDEPLLGNSQFTRTQIQDLGELEHQRLARLEVERFDLSNKERIETMRRELKQSFYGDGSHDYAIRKEVHDTIQTRVGGDIFPARKQGSIGYD